MVRPVLAARSIRDRLIARGLASTPSPMQFSLRPFQLLAGAALLATVALLGRADAHRVAELQSLRVAAGADTGRHPQPITAEGLPATKRPMDPARIESWAACVGSIEKARTEPPSEGTPHLDEVRAHLLMYVKAEPVVFVRAPRVDQTASQEAVVYRNMLANSTSPWPLLKRLWPVFSAKPDLARSVLLREGYLYAEDPALAFALVDLVSAQLLFNEERIWIHRGAELLHAERSPRGEYVFTNGPTVGQVVHLMLFDRIGVGAPPPPLHRDTRRLRQRLGFERMRLDHVNDGHIVAQLRYGSTWVPSLLRSEEAALQLECERLEPRSAPVVDAIRRRHERQERALGALRRAMIAEVREGLPFDEPKTEIGQQDGLLRANWRWAYEQGETRYAFNGDKYPVFNEHGSPYVPQVCVDFVFDTFERASGTWWRPEGERRERIVGKLDFGRAEDETLRRATSLIELSERDTKAFELVRVPSSEQIPLGKAGAFAAHLAAHADRYAPGDIVMIRGYVPWTKPWEPVVMHVHSFFVYESDPVLGMPIALAGNPGRPLLQTWQFEAFRTPRRSLWARIRPRLDWLEAHLDLELTASHDPPPLMVDRR